MPSALLLLGFLGAIVALLICPGTRRPTAITLGIVGGLLVLLCVGWMQTSAVAPLLPSKPFISKTMHNPAVNRSAAAEKTAVKPGTAPAWIDEPPRLVGDTYRMAILVGPYTTRQECDAKLPEELQKALTSYVETCLGEPVAPGIALPPDELRGQLVGDPWEEVLQSSVGPMIQLHVLVEFDHKIKDRILEENARLVVAGRLWRVGVGLVAGLALLALWYGYLRTDLATAGAYRGRLRLAMGAAILAVVAAAVAVM